MAWYSGSSGASDRWSYAKGFHDEYEAGGRYTDFLTGFQSDGGRWLSSGRGQYTGRGGTGGFSGGMTSGGLYAFAKNQWPTSDAFMLHQAP
ncbi:MAG: hypothetical protein ACRC8S_11760 [Fimbriiglobus sp.]